MEEIWKDVVGYEGLYQVSNLGRVKSCAHIVRCHHNSKRIQPSKILKNCFDGNYFHVTLFKNGKRNIQLVHRLVATSFIPNPSNKITVNHINGNKKDNNVENLEWATYSENIKHAFSNGLNIAHDGNTSKKIIAYKENGDFVGVFNSLHDAERKLNVNIGHIWCVLNGREYKAKGYIFKYL